MSPDFVQMDELVAIVRRAGREILRWYGDPGRVETKEDRTPLTEADRAAHRLLVRELAALVPELPVLSEESAEEEISERREWRRFWLVDPLDGTKEFLKGTGEFTVNVALVEGGRPVVGVVHAPALERSYRASSRLGAELSRGEEPFRPIRTRRFHRERPVMVASRDHAGPAVEELARALGPGVEFTSMGSSLKFCLVAEGRADLYPRDLPTMEWDTAAAQCVLERAGGAVYALPASGAPVEGTELTYNKDTLENPPFLAVGDPRGDWRHSMESRERGET